MFKHLEAKAFKRYFYDAWRWKIELNQPESLLHLPPSPGLLQNGCYWRHRQTCPANTTESHNTHAGVALAEISLTDTNSEGSERDTPPSEVPEPDSRGQVTASPTSPIAIEENICSQNNDTEPSEEDAQVETITSMSEGDKTQEGVMDAIPMSPAAIEAARAAGQKVQTEGERAEETEGGTTDEVIDIDVCEETTPAQVSSTPVEARVSSPAHNAPYPPSRQPNLLLEQPQIWKRQA